MIHEIFPVGMLGCNCSVIGDESTRQALVIDPGDEIERILDMLKRHQLTLQQIIVTHAHIDHVGGAMKLKRATGAPILLNKNDYALLKMLDVQAAWIGTASPGAVEIDQSLEDQDAIHCGSIHAVAMHTPGHTEGSTCLYFPSEQKLIAGDTMPLFVRILEKVYSGDRRILVLKVIAGVNRMDADTSIGKNSVCFFE